MYKWRITMHQCYVKTCYVYRRQACKNFGVNINGPSPLSFNKRFLTQKVLYVMYVFLNTKHYYQFSVK